MVICVFCRTTEQGPSTKQLRMKALRKENFKIVINLRDCSQIKFDSMNINIKMLSIYIKEFCIGCYQSQNLTNRERRKERKKVLVLSENSEFWSWLANLNLMQKDKYLTHLLTLFSWMTNSVVHSNKYKISFK